MSAKMENKITLRIEALSNKKEIIIGNHRKCFCGQIIFFSYLCSRYLESVALFNSDNILSIFQSFIYALL